MPFDGVKFHHQDRPSRPILTDNVLCILFVVLGVLLMLMPVSLGALVDIVRYAKGH